MYLGRRKREIRPVEAFAWSWKRFWLGLALALVVGLLFGLLIGLSFGLSFGLFAGLGAWLGGGLIGGVLGKSINEDARPRPNQGIWTSGRHALGFGLVSIFLITLVTVLAHAWVTTPLGTLSIVLCGGVFGSLAWGGEPYLEHYALRFFLWCSGAMPWRYVRFLEEATKRILLQRVGGGYRFIHPLFQEYFAALRIQTTANAQSHPSSPQP